MGDQIRGEDWLPEGWKVEIRVRKSGKKDRYYTDPVNGYIFRSLKDIDRYLLSGKLGKHVTKNKPKGDLDNDNPHFDFIQHVDAPSLPKKKKSIRSTGAKKLCRTAVHGQNKAKDECKREISGAENSEGLSKKGINRSPTRRRTCRPKKKIESTPFFILDPDQCDDSSVLSIPNLSDIIDSMLKEKEGSKTVYLSAPAIGSLLGEKLLGTRNNNNSSHTNKKPKFAANVCKDKGISSNKLPSIPSELIVKDDWESRSITMQNHHQEPSHEIRKIAENKAKEEPDCPLFEDLFDDPCIDFAIKTLTGSTAFGS